MAGRTVRVLGELAVDGVDLRAAVDRKARILLRMLAQARGRPIPVDQLVDALWPERPPTKPADQVAVLASRLRKVLGRDAVVHGDGGYRLHGVIVDLDELEAVVVEAERRGAAGLGAIATARVGLTLLRGDLPEPTTTAPWVLADHRAAVRLAHRARAVATAALLDGGAWPEALDLASADLAADPFDEVAARAAMRAEVLAGRPAAALQIFARLRELLVEELGTDPDPDTVALHTEVLRGEAVAAVRPPSATPLVGRASQLEHLESLATRLTHGGTRVAVVQGEAGIGKTTLLRAWTQSRVAAGDLVLTGACGALDASAPLDVVLTAIDEHLRRSADPEALLGEEAAVLAPLLGRAAVRPDGAQLDPVLGPATLYAAIDRVLQRIGGPDGLVLVIDDAHLAGPALADWLAFLLRHPITLLVVAATRSGEGTTLPATDEIWLGPLGLADIAALVGDARAGELHARSQGHPLFLAELASAPDDRLPDSLVAAVLERCDQLGDAADLVRTAAVLGRDLDIDVLAGVLGLPALEALRRCEDAAGRGLLVERDGRYSFRHDLVRSALAAGTPSARAALMHREAAHVLASRADADPLQVAEHARLGGDRAMAATALAQAAERASARFDHATAAALLSRSLDLAPSAATTLSRARVRIRLDHYAQAEQDALELGSAAGAEVAAWAAYFDRRFADAIRHADDSQWAAADDPARARALAVGGRIRHAAGDLGEAERRLREAADLALGADRVTSAAWLGVLQTHRSRPEEALALLRPVTRPGAGVEHTGAVLHALLFTGHAHAVAGRPAAALAAFARYTEEVERRQVPRFAGRGVNFSGWVWRSIGARERAADAHQEALEVSNDIGLGEMRVAALEDLAEDRLVAGDAEAASAYLAHARAALSGDLVFGWRLALKLRLHETRLALAQGDAEQARVLAAALHDDAHRLGVPRYTSVAAVLGHHAGAALGEPVDLDAVERDLGAVEAAVGLEAWWWTGGCAAAFSSRRLLDRAVTLVDSLAAECGEDADPLRAEADRRIAAWSLSVR